jgi:hypothetical protein
MTKTQQKLIDLAKSHGGCYAVECGGGRGPEGGRISYGARDRGALLLLVEQGKAEITMRDYHNEYNRGYCVRHTILAFRLIPAQTVGA